MEIGKLKTYLSFSEHEQLVPYSELSDIEYLENCVNLSVCINRSLIKSCIWSFKRSRYLTFGEHEQSVSYSELLDMKNLENGVKFSVCINRRLIISCIRPLENVK